MFFSFIFAKEGYKKGINKQLDLTTLGSQVETNTTMDRKIIIQKMKITQFTPEPIYHDKLCS